VPLLCQQWPPRPKMAVPNATERLVPPERPAGAAHTRTSSLQAKERLANLVKASLVSQTNRNVRLHRLGQRLVPRYCDSTTYGGQGWLHIDSPANALSAAVRSSTSISPSPPQGAMSQSGYAAGFVNAAST